MTSSDVTGSISKLRSEVEQAQDRSAQSYLRDLYLYNKSATVAGSELANFEAWGEKFGIYYAWAKSEQKRLESDYTLAATKASSSVGLVLLRLIWHGIPQRSDLGKRTFLEAVSYDSQSY